MCNFPLFTNLVKINYEAISSTTFLSKKAVLYP